MVSVVARCRISLCPQALDEGVYRPALKVQSTLFDALDCAVTFDHCLFRLPNTGIRGFDIVAVNCGRLPFVLTVVSNDVSIQQWNQQVFGLPDVDHVL